MVLVLYTHELGKTAKKTQCNVNLTLDWSSDSSDQGMKERMGERKKEWGKETVRERKKE